MFEAYKYSVETHSHSSPASGCSSIPPEQLVEDYHGIGAEAVCLTNHFGPAVWQRGKKDGVAAYLDDYHRACAEGEAGVAVILGLELRFLENDNDYLISGIDESDAYDIFDYIGGDLVTFRKNYKNDRMIFIQAHPFRNGIKSVDPELLDGMEVFNLHHNHNSRVGVAARYVTGCKKDLIPTCGSDYHDPGFFGLGMTRFRTLPRDSHDLAALLRSRDFLFDIGGYIVVPPCAEKFAAQA